MSRPESEKAANRREWENLDNWHGPRWIGFYASANDTRIIVPKRIPAMGWTFNFAKPAAMAIILVLINIAVFVPLIIWWMDKS